LVSQAENVFGLFVEALHPAVDDPEILAATCRQDREVRTHGVLDESRSTGTAAGSPVDSGHDLDGADPRLTVARRRIVGGTAPLANAVRSGTLKSVAQFRF